MMQRISEIFHTYKFLETNSNFCMKMFREKFKTQLVWFDEGAKSTLWAKGKQDKCKTMLEGGGLPMEEKYMSAK